MRADFKLVAKAYGRIGRRNAKQDQLEQAVNHFEKSLTEHRTPDIRPSECGDTRSCSRAYASGVH